jgi:hypothetical protein
MEYQTLIDVVAGLVMASIGWFAREIWYATKELRQDLANLREELPKTYITRDDYKSDIKEIKDMLQRLFDRLDHKADK